LNDKTNDSSDDKQNDIFNQKNHVNIVSSRNSDRS